MAFYILLMCGGRFQIQKVDNSPNLLNNAVIADDGKPEFLTYFADWLQKWSSESSNFLLTKQTSNALIQTLRAQAELIKELLSDGYLFVMTGRFQYDPIERRFSQYRQMSGGRFW